jgi:Membrane bound beta barrel domain (DUF5777)
MTVSSLTAGTSRRGTHLLSAVSVVVAAATVLVLGLCAPSLATAQDDPDRDLKVSQPDFTLITLPTTLRLPRYRSAFRVTHRFLRPLGAGDFSDLLSDFFGLDSGAQIGLEYRFGLMRGLQAGINRTSDKTIEFFTEYSLMQQQNNGMFGLAAIASIDGTNNFQNSYSPSLGVVLSRELGEHGALYFEPIWVNNSNPDPSELANDNDTIIYGLGARLRIRPTVYVVGEFLPRTGYRPGVNHGSFAIEKRVGGHVFQLNFSDSFATTMGQLARGGTNSDDWYLGFNISRKFF